MFLTPRTNVLALDPATVTGYAHSNGQYGTWTLKGDKVQALRRYITEAYDVWGFACIAYEDANQGSRNRRTIQFHNEMAGVIKLVAADLGVFALPPFNPLSIKKETTGFGKAPKEQMVAAVERFYGIKLTQKEHDIADAIAILKMAERGYMPPKVEKKHRKKAQIRLARKQKRLF